MIKQGVVWGLFGLLFISSLFGNKILYENFLKTEPGDFIVVSQNKAFTLLMIYAKEGSVFTVEEATIPSNRTSSHFVSWRNWYEEGAPGATCWVRYQFDINSNQITEAYSFTQRGRVTLSKSDNILTQLIHLDFRPIPLSERKRAGQATLLNIGDRRPIWQPRLIVDGRQIEGAFFDGWKACWPRDNSDLSGKVMEVYLPSNQDLAPSYFPYCLEIQGMLGSAKIRVIDSGKKIKSPHKLS